MSTRQCPKCEIVELVRQVHGKISVDLCPKCDGVWLDKGELDKIAHPHQGDLEYCSLGNEAMDKISDSRCPSCPDAHFDKIHFISYSDIIIEHCSTCGGFWLDRGELEAINVEIDKLQKVPESWEHRIMVFLAELPF